MHEHHLAFVTGDHPTAGGRLLDGEVDDGAWGEHGKKAECQDPEAGRRTSTEEFGHRAVYNDYVSLLFFVLLY